MTHPATELTSTLRVAAQAAYLDGASPRQINMIVALCRSTGNYNLGIGGRLTKRAASGLIDRLIESGAEPDYDKSNQERAAEKARADEIDAMAADKAARNAIERAARKAARAAANATGQKVRHAKFGIGSVIAEDDRTFTAIFPKEGEAKVLKQFLEIV